MMTMAPRDRRTLMAGVAAIALLIACFRVVPAWLRWRAALRTEAAEAITYEHRSRDIMRRFAVSLDSLEARAARLQTLGSSLLTGETRQEAAANLTAVLAELARASLVRLDAIEVRSDSAADRALSRIRVEAQATADIAGLAGLLRNLQAGPPLLAVRALSVRPQAIDAPADRPELLSIRFTIEGVALVRPRVAAR
jgi:hypothetical protein